MAPEQRLIDANNLSVMIEETAQGLADCDQQNASWALRKYAIRDITEAPTVDAVEVVRCKACQHWQKRYETRGICLKHNAIVTFSTPDFYCACGERRNDER